MLGYNWGLRMVINITKALHGRLAGRFKPPLAGRCNDFAPSRQKNCHRHKQPSRPGPRKKKTPPRPVPSKKKKSHPVPPRKKTTTAPSRLGKKQQPPCPASKKKTPSRRAMNSKIHRPEGGNWKQIPPPVYFSLFLYRIVLACLDAFLVSELCLSPLLFLQIKVSVEPFVVGLEFAVANFLIVQVKK